ncbi:MAG: lysophospholipid acyltransferase family protein [Gemmatimonadota bacterium]
MAQGRGREALIVRRLGQAIVSAVVWALWALLIILFTPIVAVVFLLTAWWDRPRWWTGRAFRRLAWSAMVVHPLWRRQVVGSLPPRSEGPFVGVSNHESLADVAVIGALPWETKWISKRENFRIPFLGFMMWLAGDISVDRDDPESRSEAYEELKRWLARGASVMIFPEGTRSRTGEMLRFKNGAFRLAVETERPIVPLAVACTREGIRKGSMVFRPTTTRLAILDPVPVEDLGLDDVSDLRDRVKDEIREARNRLRAAGFGERASGGEPPG